jgi:hypothetical protein
LPARSSFRSRRCRRFAEDAKPRRPTGVAKEAKEAKEEGEAGEAGEAKDMEEAEEMGVTESRAVVWRRARAEAGRGRRLRASQAGTWEQSAVRTSHDGDGAGQADTMEEKHARPRGSGKAERETEEGWRKSLRPERIMTVSDRIPRAWRDYFAGFSAVDFREI